MPFYATKCIKVTVGIITVHMSDIPRGSECLKKGAYDKSAHSMKIII